MTDTGEETASTARPSPSSSPTGDAAAPPTRPWRFTAVFTLIGLMCLAFAVASLTADRTTAAVIEVFVGAAFLLAAVAGRQIRNRQAARSHASA